MQYLHLLIPIGAVGLVRWLMWLAKRIPALFYRPIRNDYNTSATIVTPVYKEDPALFRRAIESWIANGPDHIIAVIDVTDEACMAVAREYPQIDVLPIDLPGKRAALAMGVNATATDIVVLVDSDVLWEPGVLAKLKMPFIDPEIGGVGTRQNMIPSDGHSATLWERLADIYLDIRYADEVPATTVVGRAVSCLSGRTAAYRTRLLQSMRDAFLNETFMGHPCMSGDDKRYTCLVLQRGYRTWNQLDARVYSTFKPDFRGFVKQRIRWSRNSFRSDLRALWQGWVWKHVRGHPAGLVARKPRHQDLAAPAAPPGRLADLARVCGDDLLHVAGEGLRARHAQPAQVADAAGGGSGRRRGAHAARAIGVRPPARPCLALRDPRPAAHRAHARPASRGSHLALRDPRPATR
jgi:glycosyltransferase involved in cell wall biosynthesis